MFLNVPGAQVLLFFIVYYKMLRNEAFSKSSFKKAPDLYLLPPFLVKNLIYNENTDSFTKHLLKKCIREQFRTSFLR